MGDTMIENIYDRINRTLTWKRVLTFNLGLFIVLIIPLSVQLAGNSTENRSGAALSLNEEVVEPPASYPVENPRLDRVTMFFGKKGDTIVLLGNNFGDYQWGSSVYVGNALANKDNVVRWSNSVIEVKIPESAVTGQVWVVVNGKRAGWDGSLILSDTAQAARVGLTKLSSNSAGFDLSLAPSVVRGMLELGYVSEPIEIVPGSNTEILSTSTTADALGKKIQVQFSVNGASPAEARILTINHPGIGAIELVRVELYDSSNRLLPVYADPLMMKVLP